MSKADVTGILDTYRQHADDIGKRFLELDADEFLAPVRDYLPDTPSDLLDLGAGSGRDAIWFTRHGHRVTAVEPVAELAAQGQKADGGTAVEWIIDGLPGAASLNGREGGFDLVWLCAVWHHLDSAMREATLVRVANLARPGGRFILSLRQSPDIDGMLTFDADADGTIAMAARHGFRLVHRTEASSAQTHNRMAQVTWVWLVLDLVQEASQ